MSTPWVAGAETLYGEPTAFERAVLFYGFHAVDAAGGCVAAPHAKEWRDGPLVEADNACEQYGEQLTHLRKRDFYEFFYALYDCGEYLGVVGHVFAGKDKEYVHLPACGDCCQ